MEGNRNQLKKDKIVYLILLVLMILCFFFPFKIIETVGGVHTNLFGFNSYVTPSRKIVNGFEFPLSYFTFLFIPLAVSLIVFSSKKAAKIIGLIVAISHMLFMVFLYFAINFNLNLFGPKLIVTVGIGYFFLLGLSVLFLIQIIVTLRNSLLVNVKPLPLEDLLDDFS